MRVLVPLWEFNLCCAKRFPESQWLWPQLRQALICRIARLHQRRRVQVGPGSNYTKYLSWFLDHKVYSDLPKHLQKPKPDELQRSPPAAVCGRTPFAPDRLVATNEFVQEFARILRAHRSGWRFSPQFDEAYETCATLYDLNKESVPAFKTVLEASPQLRSSDNPDLIFGSLQYYITGLVDRLL